MEDSNKHHEGDISLAQEAPRRSKRTQKKQKEQKETSVESENTVPTSMKRRRSQKIQRSRMSPRLKRRRQNDEYSIDSYTGSQSETSSVNKQHFPLFKEQETIDEDGAVKLCTATSMKRVSWQPKWVNFC